ncbi:hypothetical protein PMIN07_001867 [Paraphaeosphaeria minitans]
MANVSYPSWSLEGKVAVVTGSGRGIGKEMALELARRGCSVAVNYANAKEAAEEVVKQIEGMKTGAKAIAIKANVADVKQTQYLMDEVVKQFGKLDICCSNSGVVSFGHFKDVEEAEYDRVMQINTRGQFFVAKEAYKRMSVGGRIILMGSITGQAKGVPKHAVYSGSKGAIETFTRCMAIGMFSHRLQPPDLSLTVAQMLARRRSLSTASHPVVSRPTCTTLYAASTSLTARTCPMTRSTYTPLPGHRSAVLASPSTSPALSASWHPRMATGSTERSLVSMVLLACNGEMIWSSSISYSSSGVHIASRKISSQV